LDPFEYPAQAFSALRVDHLHEPDATLQMRPEPGVFHAVLTFRTEANTIGKGCLEAIEVGPDHVYPLICDQTCQMLPYSLAHDTRLAEMHCETLLHQDCCYVCREGFDSSFKLSIIAGERKI
jgi:hypothetical protein